MRFENANWSVRLLLDEAESRAFSSFRVWPVDQAVQRMIVGGGWRDEIDQLPFVTLEMWASDANAAEDLARRLVSDVLAEAGLPPRRLPLVWTAPLGDDAESGHRFLEQAKDLVDSEQFELAVVAAHMHFELQLRLLLERAAGKREERWAQRLTANRRVAMLGNDVSKAVVELLLGVDVTQAPNWAEFSAHIERRNAVVHEGRAVGAREAQASIGVVQALWADLASAERSVAS